MTRAKLPRAGFLPLSRFGYSLLAKASNWAVPARGVLLSTVVCRFGERGARKVAEIGLERMLLGGKWPFQKETEAWYALCSNEELTLGKASHVADPSWTTDEVLVMCSVDGSCTN